MRKSVNRNARQRGRGKGTAKALSGASENSRPSLKAVPSPMSDVTYEIVQHEDGWAYKVNGVFSEAFATHVEALAAAQVAAAEQEIPGDTESIEYEDDKGEWHTETARGRDRPHTVVKDSDR